MARGEGFAGDEALEALFEWHFGCWIVVVMWNLVGLLMYHVLLSVSRGLKLKLEVEDWG